MRSLGARAQSLCVALALSSLSADLLGASAWKVCKVNPNGSGPGSPQTKAIQSAIDDCAADGGGEVVLDGGNFTSGSLWLRSNILLRIPPGSALLGSTDRSNATYPQIYTRVGGVMGFSPASLLNGAVCEDLSGFNASKVGDQCKRWGKLENVTVTGNDQAGGMRAAGAPIGAAPGSGVIDGQGEGWWHSGVTRPTLLGLLWVRGLTLTDLFLTRSPFWTTHPAFSEDIVADGLTVRTTGPNTDGFDPDSCSNVLLTRSDLSCGDDVIAIKSGKDEDGRAVGIPSTNITIRDCKFGQGHGLSIGSEMSGNVTNVIVTNVVMEGTEKGVRLKSGKGRGGVIRNVTYSGMVLKNVGTPVSVSLDYTSPSSPGPYPHFSDITVRNVTSESSGGTRRGPGGRPSAPRDESSSSLAGQFLCLKDSPCTDGFVLQGIQVQTASEWKCEYARVSATHVSPSLPSECK